MDKSAGGRPAYLSPVVDEPEQWVEARDESLLRLVERHVIPRLSLETGEGAERYIRDRFGDGLAAEIVQLTDLALEGEDERAMALLHRLHRDGLTFSQLQLGIIATAARRLNAYWVDDRASFVEVAQASGSLKRLMRFIALDLAPRGVHHQRHKSILIAPAPGDNHNLGAAMAVEYYRRDGWTVRHVPAATTDMLVTALGADWFDAIAFSVTDAGHVQGLAGTIRQARQASRNPRLLVLVAGEAILRTPALVEAAGADATIAPLPTAPARTYRLLRALYGTGG